VRSGPAFGAELVAVTVAEPDQAELWTDVVERLHARSALDLGEWCSEAAASIPQRRLVLDGDPRTALLDAAEQESADLVVVGSRGLGSMRRLLLGSVSSALAEHIEVPVAIVPPGRGT
jgi:nucleotide-binding universal stress UspA family protein